MSGRDKQVDETGHLSEEGEFIGRTRSESGPAADQFLLAELWDEVAGEFEEVRDAIGGIGFLKAGEFFGGAGEDESIGAGDEIAFAEFKHALEDRGGGFEQQHLSSHGKHRELHAELFEDVCGPCTGCNANATGLQTQAIDGDGCHGGTGDFQLWAGGVFEEIDVELLAGNFECLQMPWVANLSLFREPEGMLLAGVKRGAECSESGTTYGFCEDAFGMPLPCCGFSGVKIRHEQE